MGEISSENTPYKIWQGSEMKELREKMKNFEWGEGCRNCKLKEDRGLKSKRMHWETLDFVSDLWGNKDIFETEPPVDIYHLDIAFGNLCNFKCRMCSVAYSTSWKEDEIFLMKNGLAGSGGLGKKTSVTLNDNPRELTKVELEGIVKNLTKVRRIEILGGEPFLSKSFYEFLKLCRQYNIGSSVELMVTTNASSLNQENLDLLNHFEYVNLNISVDSTGKLFEYMRSSGACTWEKINENIDFALSYCKGMNQKNPEKCWKVNINSSFQLYNMNNLADFTEWVFEKFDWSPGDEMMDSMRSKRRNSFEIRILVGPRHLGVNIAPEEMIDKSLSDLEMIKEKYSFLKNITEKTYIDNIEKALKEAKTRKDNNKQLLWNCFCYYTRLLDLNRNESLSEVDSELDKLINKTELTEQYKKQVHEWKNA